MKLLAIVEDRLKDVLGKMLECGIDFRSAWDEVDCARMREYGFVLVSGCIVEKSNLSLWGVASAIRYFGVAAAFVDVSFDAGNTLARIYPQIKVVSWSGNSSQLLLQLRTCAPVLFRECAAFMNSTSSAIANAWRFEENAEKNPRITSLGSIPNRDPVQPLGNAVRTVSISGDMSLGARPSQQPAQGSFSAMRQISHSLGDAVKRAVPSSLGAISSIPLGVSSVRASEKIQKTISQERGGTSTSFKKEGFGSGRVVPNFDFAVSDISSISAISGISDISGEDEMMALEKAIAHENGGVKKNENDVKSVLGPVIQESDIAAAEKEDSIVSAISALSDPQMYSENHAISGFPSGFSGLGSSSNGANDKSASPHDASSHRGESTLVIRRSMREVTSGGIEFGTLIRVIHTLCQLKQTGTLDAQNDTRSIKIEFRQGKVSTTIAPALIMSALNWTVGEYSFNSSQMLSYNAKPLDAYRMIAQVVLEQLPLNPILRALESEFNSYIALTSSFHPENEALGGVQWWKQCDGTMQLSDLMMAHAADMEHISRSIYRAWLCDEVCFLKTSTEKRVRVEYETSRIRVSEMEAVKSEMNNTIDAADSSHLNSIRIELQKVRESFDKEDGYTILGLKPGCGTKALDDAYYAWVNRYHTDRFVRFKEPSFIKTANELLMLMNATYSKLVKMERNGVAASRVTEEARRKINEASGMPDVSSRLGAARPRIRSIQAYQENAENSPLNSISKELQAIEQARAKVNKRAPIRPASTSSLNEKPAFGVGTPQNGQYLKMSDVLAKKRAQTQEIYGNRRRAQTFGNDMSQRGQAEGRADVSRIPPQNPQIRTWASASVTPDQLFQTAKKKITLGLAQEALVSLNGVLEIEPDNPDYIVYHAYASFLVEPHRREECLEKILNVYREMAAQYPDINAISADEKARFFAPCYFIGKLYIASEKYVEAGEYLKIASKLNASDVDTQRCLRYVAMQCEKQQNELARPKGFFSMFKDRFGKS